MAHDNLDATAAKLGFRIVQTAEKPKEIETLINKSLGVLSSNGVYALWLFLQSENKDKNIDIVSFIEEFSIELDGGSEEEKIINLSNSIQNLLFAKELLEKILIYARYRAKAMK